MTITSLTQLPRASLFCGTGTPPPDAEYVYYGVQSPNGWCLWFKRAPC